MISKDLLRAQNQASNTALATTDVYQQCLLEAIRLAQGMVQVLVDAGEASLRAKIDTSTDMNIRNDLHDAAGMLVQHRLSLIQIVPEHLRKAVNAAARGEVATLAKPTLLRFDQLELMDDVQVQENVEMARGLQNATRTCEAALSALDARICAAQGMSSVRADRNPLRPQIFNEALRDALAELEPSVSLRLLWMQHMTPTLGTQLHTLYHSLIQFLIDHQVQEAPYAVVGNPAAATARTSAQPNKVTRSGDSAQSGQAQAEQHSPLNQERLTAPEQASNESSQDNVLKVLEGFSQDDVSRLGITLEQLRDLLAGNAVDEVAAALAAMKEVAPAGHIAQTLPALSMAQEASEKHEVQDAQEFQTTQALSKLSDNPSDPALAQEVVRMMVENILLDERLLSSVREAVGALGSALIALAQHDPRYINNKAHPAMVLLHEITTRSLAFASERADGFAAYFDPVLLAIQELSMQQVVDHLPFERAWAQISKAWGAQQAFAKAARDQAVQALLRAEQRNLLAEKISFELISREDAHDAPIFIKKFLIGPWAQVVADIRLQEGNAQDDRLGYSGAVADLLWSCQVLLARKNRPRLVRTIPRLLATLREGLLSIAYPEDHSKAFFEELMLLHEQALKPPTALEIAASLAAAEAAKDTIARPSEVNSRQQMLDMMQEADQGQAWLAPQEARDSGFLDNSSAAEFASILPQAMLGEIPSSRVTQPYPYAKHAEPYMSRMKIGCWVEFQNNEQWVRAQLTWASPHSTLYMFTLAGNKPYSMTRQALEKMVVKNLLRMVANEGVVVSALDAVAQTAVRNTINRINP